MGSYVGGFYFRFILLDPASIVETRLTDNGCVEYFVHYLNCRLGTLISQTPLVDRRLDEWVSADRIDTTSKFAISAPLDGVLFVPGQNDGRLTRHQKRRYEEMNSTPSVSSFLQVTVRLN